jgi:hypothetical protein
VGIGFGKIPLCRKIERAAEIRGQTEKGHDLSFQIMPFDNAPSRSL